MILDHSGKVEAGHWGVAKMTKEQWKAIVDKANIVRDRELAWNLKQPLNTWKKEAVPQKRTK